MGTGAEVLVSLYILGAIAAWPAWKKLKEHGLSRFALAILVGYLVLTHFVAAFASSDLGEQLSLAGLGLCILFIALLPFLRGSKKI